MIVGLVVHPTRAEALSCAKEFVVGASERDIGIVADAETADELSGIEPTGLEKADLIVSIGGDGTVLEAARRAMELDVPVLGVNLGRIGFLAEIDRGDITPILDRIAAREYDVEDRMTLKAEVEDGPTVHALNDVVIDKRVSQRLVTLAVEVDGVPFRTYRADGIVVATPTGSTAYSFSAGGPAVAPGLEALIMTAVAPHSLFSRSLVFEPDRVLRFTAGSDRPVGVEVDASDLGALEPGQSVTVARGDMRAKFATVGGTRFPNSLKHKLGLE